MGVLDVLSDIGLGVFDATNAAQEVYRNLDKTQQSGIATQQRQRVYDANVEADMFNAQAGADLMAIEQQKAQRRLATAKADASYDQYDPVTKQHIADIARATGGVGTAEFNTAISDYFASRGMLDKAEPRQNQAKVITAAEQSVAANLRRIPGYENVATVTRGEDGQLYGFTGEPDAEGNYDVVELPDWAIRNYEALTGNTKLLGLATKTKQQDLANQATAAGVFPGAPRPRANSATGVKPMTQAQSVALIGNIPRFVDAYVKQGKTLEEAQQLVLQQLIVRGIDVTQLTGVASAPARLSPQDFIKRRIVTPVTGKPSQQSAPVRQPTPTSPYPSDGLFLDDGSN
jgi:hypothetical protein